MMKLFAVLFVGTLILGIESFAQAGRLNGPGVGTKRCEAHATVTYYETFRGGEPAVISIRGDGDTDLDLFVYDAQGRLVAEAIGPSDRETVQFYVPSTSTYRIVVRNLGNVWNRFGMATN
jgi:hypothetical protein